MVANRGCKKKNNTGNATVPKYFTGKVADGRCRMRKREDAIIFHGYGI